MMMGDNRVKSQLLRMQLKVDAERAQAWIKTGAQPTDTVRSLLKKAGAL